jgi:hypothetical protein
VSLLLVIWAGGLVLVLGLAAAARRGDEQLEALSRWDAEWVRHKGGAVASPSELVSRACRSIGSRRGALWTARPGTLEPEIVARYIGDTAAETIEASAARLITAALAADTVVAEHVLRTVDAHGTWMVRAVAVPVRDAAGNRGALYLGDFPAPRVLRADDRRGLQELAASAAPFLGARFTRREAPVARVPALSVKR